jgi:hypothetical protein
MSRPPVDVRFIRTDHDWFQTCRGAIMSTTLVVVLLACAAFVALLTYVAFRRGWFRLEPPTSETQGHFILMLKKNLIPEQDKKVPPTSRNL